MAERLSKFLIKLTPEDNRHGVPTLAHWCPACLRLHEFAVERGMGNRAQWMYNGNAIAPTFHPEMNFKVGPDAKGRVYTCRYRLQEGKIKFYADSSHPLRGQTHDLPSIPPEVWKKFGLKPEAP